MPTRTDRLDLRLTPDQKDLLRRAAALSGQPVTGFAVSALVERAQDMIDRFQRTVLSRRDGERFLDILASDTVRAPALKVALRRMSESRRKDVEVLRSKFGDLLGNMQTSAARKGIHDAFSASPKEMGKAALKAARHRG